MRRSSVPRKRQLNRRLRRLRRLQAQQALRSDSSRVTHCEKCTGKGHASVNSGNFCEFLRVDVSTLPGYHQRHVVQCSPWNSDSGVSSPGRGFFEKLNVETTHSFKVPLCRAGALLDSVCSMNTKVPQTQSRTSALDFSFNF